MGSKGRGYRSVDVDGFEVLVGKGAKENDRLTTRVALLMEREASREADSEGSIFLGDERPPHY